MSTTTLQSSPPATSHPVTATIAIMTNNGSNYLTVANNGGLAATAKNVAIDSHGKSLGDNEKFIYVPLGTTHFALLTANGKNYVTAAKGGGIGGANNGTCPVHTNATKIGPWEILTLTRLDDHDLVAVSTSSGYYLSAINGGGIGDGGTNTTPIHTDATTIGPWETFTVVPVLPAAQA